MSAVSASAAVRSAALSAGDVSGNCDAALIHAESGAYAEANRELEWAEKNVRTALSRICEARAALAAAEAA